MALRDLSDPEAVHEALAEFDRLGRDAFLTTHGFGPSRAYVVRTESREYDSKAIAGVAHGYQFPDLGPLAATDFNGGIGARGAARKLRTLGFEIVALDEPTLTGYWWVNQGTSYAAERDGGYLWASTLGKSGATIDHHMNVERLVPGDVILHYSSGLVSAVSRVTEAAIETLRPDPQEPGDTERQGFLARADYFDCPQPLHRDEIPLRLRLDEQGPFNRVGRPKQVYLLPLSEDFIAALQDLFPDRFGGTPISRQERAVWLFQANPKMYDLDAELPNVHLGTPDSWTISRYEDQIQEDDIALFWTGGDRAGVRAMGRISGESFQRDEPRFTSGETETAIPYRYGLVLNEPILKSQLQEDPVLGDLTVIKAPRGANFRVSPDQWSVLRELILEVAQRDQPEVHTKRIRHLLFKWATDFEPDTIAQHQAVEQAHGSVWWGKFGKPGSRPPISQKRLRYISSQLEDGVETYAFLYRAGEVWRTTLQEITLAPDEVDVERLPSYYTKDQCVLFARVADFIQLEPDWPLEHLLLANNPDPTKIAGALGNQTSPLAVFISDEEDDVAPTAEILSFDWLQGRTLWSREALEEVISAITTPPGAQIVLAGPPGTGKTWVAKHLVRYLTQDRPLAYRIVQFHPSYGYEEFIEGLRPIVTDGGIEFTRVDGLVLETVNQMEEGEDLHFVLIDEMNRANLPRVFGELMYLLEYRGEDESIDLQYSRDFALPHNLRFVGTMNTADRSIRTIDTALRRRFEIIDCPPDERILEAYYAAHENQVPDLVSGFSNLNQRLTENLDRHHTIGHTFFMKDPMTGPRLGNVWKRQVAPLVEEYFFDQPDVAASYDPAEFWPSVFKETS